MSDRKNARGYVFGAALASVALGGVPSLLQKAHGQVVTNAAFTFENSFSTFSSTSSGSTAASGTKASSSASGSVFGTSGQNIGPLVAESGTGSAYGFHAATATVYSFPAGNGSLHAFSSNNFAVGDYYEFDVPTTATQSVIISFDQTSSSTGPKDFQLLAIDAGGGQTYTLGTYTVLASVSTLNSTGGTTSAGFATGTSVAAFNVSTTTTIPALLSNTQVAFRLQLLDTTAENGGVLAGTGTDRVDNFTVVSSPEPSTLMLAAGGLLALQRRKRKPSKF